MLLPRMPADFGGVVRYPVLTYPCTHYGDLEAASVWLRLAPALRLPGVLSLWCALGLGRSGAQQKLSCWHRDFV